MGALGLQSQFKTPDFWLQLWRQKCQQRATGGEGSTISKGENTVVALSSNNRNEIPRSKGL